MKKLKFLPMLFMLLVCLGVFGLGVYAGTPSKNDVTGNINVGHLNSKVIISAYKFNADGTIQTTPFINKLTVRIITNYTIQQRVQKEKKVGMEFIDKAFAYLKKEVPDYKKNKYYEERTVLKRTIEKSKLLTKIYCLQYRKKA